jgi:hypothetical protein
MITKNATQILEHHLHRHNYRSIMHVRSVGTTNEMTGGIVDPSELGETRAFLDEDRSNDGSSHDTKTRIKVSRAKLLAAW